MCKVNYYKMSKKPNQVPFTLGEENIKLVDEAYEFYGCRSRSELLKKIIGEWIFANKPLIALLRKNGK